MSPLDRVVCTCNSEGPHAPLPPGVKRTQLRDLDKTLVIQDNYKPLAVLKYEHFLAMRERIKDEG